jgi:hypothetical protein
MTKSDTLKLPKRIAGVKVPKVLRRPGTIVDFLNSPVGRLVLAEALIAAAAALKNYKHMPRRINRFGRSGLPEIRERGTVVTMASETILVLKKRLLPSSKLALSAMPT